jgi:hypothetical protein
MNTASANGSAQKALAEVHKAAQVAFVAGLSIVPARSDGSKRPIVAWKPFQEARCSRDQAGAWWGDSTTLGVVCGRVSGGVECLDFDNRETYDKFIEATRALGMSAPVERVEAGYVEDTPGGGVHWLYRCNELGGNAKLANRPGPPDDQGRPTVETLIETRGEGGFVIVAPSFGTVHESGRPYTLRRGGFATIATVTPEERRALLDLAGTFDEIPKPPPPPPAHQDGPRQGGGTRPGDDFQARASWAEILAGWSPVHVQGDKTYWRRPGKETGWSATSNYGGDDQLYVFSSSTALEPRKFYTKFSAYAHLHHDGDYKAAAGALAAQGYGDRPRRPARPSSPHRNGHAEGLGPTSQVRKSPPGDLEDPPPPAEPDPPADREPDARPEIEVTTRRHEVVEQAIGALARDPDLYHRGESLVVVAEEKESTVRLTTRTTLTNVLGAPKVLALSDSVVGCYLTRNASFYAWRKLRGDEEAAVDIHPPDWLIKAVATRKHWPGVRPLLAVVECPYPRADGSIVETPGYDPETGTLYRPSMAFPEVPEHPTREDAMEAWSRLRELVEQFPFETEDDRAVWLAGVLNAVARPAIPGPVPGVAVIGNKASCGKGLLIDLCGIIAHGRNVPTSGYPDEKPEAGKVVVSIALGGRQIVHFDNLEEGSGYGNSALDRALTSEAVDDRELGKSKMTGAVSLRVAWFLSGNNLGPKEDAYRRWLVCNLVTDLERPEERRDIKVKDLRGYAREHRGELVRDALTILKAHALADRPCGDWAPLGSFEAWDPIIRGAVWFATGWDCCKTQRIAADLAPARLARAALLEGWRELPGGTPGSSGGSGVTAARALDLATKDPATYATLHGALVHLSRDGKMPSPRSLGSTIRGMRGNTIDGMKFIEAGEEHKVIRWAVAGPRPAEDAPVATPEPEPELELVETFEV